MPTLQDLREERASVWEDMKAIMDRSGNNPAGEDAKAYDTAEAKYDQLDEQIERGERHQARDKSMNTVDRRGVVPGPRNGGPDDEDDETDERYLNVFRSFIQNGAADLEPEDRRVLRDRMNKDLPKNAAGVGTGSAGGYLVPPEFRNTIVETMKWYGPMLVEAEEVETATGANLPWPTNDDTGNVGAILAENAQISEQDVTLGTASIDAYMYTSKLVRASWQLLQDRPDFDTWLARKLGQRIGRILNQHFTTGTGSSQPDGIVTSATVGVTGTGSFASTGGISGDNLIDLVESLDPAYGGLEGLKFMGHQSVRKAVRKLKDSQGQYLWQPSLQGGVPTTLWGYPFVLNNDMATLAASSKSLLFGSIREAYVYRTVRDTTLVRLAERYADFLQVGFFAFKRADGTMQDANAVRVFQTTATA